MHENKFLKTWKNSKIANSKVLLFFVLMYFQNLHCYHYHILERFPFQNWLEFFLYIYLVCWLIETNKSCYSFKFSNTYLKNSKKLNQTKTRNLLQMCICCQLSAVKKRGKIQTGLNCEYDGLSEIILSLSHSKSLCTFLI